MRGYVNIPNTMYVRGCAVCGARPIIALVNMGSYTVKCPANNSHYHTEPGLIDLELWNRNNNSRSAGDHHLNLMPVI